VRRLLDGTERKIDWTRIRGRGGGSSAGDEDPTP
jgi:hypothetical protein